ncbi:chemotaxis-specific protein-glutamate methyltransferase CheB [Cellulomonas sp. zg-ZUI222]|uniref:Protein-glutamate methylesterase/protein-glutamine glutaminase n=1 Tax=Cellulomonas wangleii TaxID=2816956 RepID=A0ABX8DAF9_9CELL|nr:MULTISPECIES: chemotaxis-specific protein-glutamate methyltransferase CheB [Cellulomonas]MBO0901251.1 chemotaxis-specific protein-glutamate methyltransferase CheB [Cellulomonas sp. zg-ZUI22]MBO0922440.1 chemotaxis-specific protein-glutamate methyltransferase CheB [Cellulomonas wangleii]MBO0924881.1 chemotaxis-specific protein-glutamate methyltransferase CheB [Cellulomonas wangleii]QVI63047.1 chemotaxis-specific protein-glutamate methyltransferase CheB [Cellulomonas wangleii]
MTRTRVLVVDDSVVVRRLVTDALSREPAIEVVGVAADGRIAQAKVAQLAPDVITMDVEMPQMDGIEAVRALRAAGHRQPVIMFSTATERGAIATLDALAAGASDYVTKPSNLGSLRESLDQVVRELVPRILALAPRPAGGAGLGTGAPVTTRGGAPAVLAPPRPPHRVEVVVVGASTGGPEALSRVLAALPVLPVPVAVVQHMPPVFTRQLAARLDRLGPHRVAEAAHGVTLLPGHVHVAPGDHHLEVHRAGGGLVTALTQAPPVNFCRPAVDVLLSSAAQAAGAGVLAVVLTGMGADGRTGAERVVTAGGRVVVQDERTSVVWGMPGAVAAAGWAHGVLPLGEIAQRIAATVDEGLRAPAGEVAS